eukprot:GHVU01218652.1.p1 GENE.GHVU01218652.1~~GHVU01218652.1.p1  ORF type:complete len:115 (-),score=5.70 GHVU01218652.1:205-549(-)
MHAGVLLPPPTFVEWTAYIDQWVKPGTKKPFVKGTWNSLFQLIEGQGLAANVGSCDVLRNVLHDQGVKDAMIDLPEQKLYMRTVKGEWIILKAVGQVRYLPKNLQFLIVSANGT